MVVSTDSLAACQTALFEKLAGKKPVVLGHAEPFEFLQNEADALERVFTKGAESDKRSWLCLIENIYRLGYPIERKLGPVGAAQLHRRITDSWSEKRLAGHYASALLGKNEEDTDEIDTTAARMETLHSAWVNLGHDARLKLTHGAAEYADLAVFAEAITGVIGSGLTAGFVLMLAYQRRMKLISPVYRLFRTLYMDKSIQVTVTSPVKIPHDLKERLETSVKAKLKNAYPEKRLRFCYPQPAVECEDWMKDCIRRHLLPNYIESIAAETPDPR